MIAPRQMKLYQLNMVRELRAREKKSEQNRRYLILACIGSGLFLLLSFLYSGISIWNMELVLQNEKRKVDHLTHEFRNYTAAKDIVDKNDVELLNSLHGRGIMWTKKLAALANHLPENFQLTSFEFRGGELRVKGFGYPNESQDHLLILDKYIGRLREDSAFSNTFKRIYLGTASRSIADNQPTIDFEFSAFTATAGQKQ